MAEVITPYLRLKTIDVLVLDALAHSCPPNLDAWNAMLTIVQPHGYLHPKDVVLRRLHALYNNSHGPLYRYTVQLAAI